MSLRLVLIDDHHLFREGIRAVLAGFPDITVVGEASDAREAYSVVDATKPDIVVLDLSLPGADGIAVTREITRRDRNCKVLILSMHLGHDYVLRALEAGAAGYASKDQPPEAVVEAIRAVARGETYLSPRIPRSILDEHMQRGQRPSVGPLDRLSPREREIFDLVVQGLSNQNVATELCISVKTVETHRANINRKLGVHSATELVRLAALHGLVRE